MTVETKFNEKLLEVRYNETFQETAGYICLSEPLLKYLLYAN
jgi:hypothetical protein